MKSSSKGAADSRRERRNYRHRQQRNQRCLPTRDCWGRDASLFSLLSFSLSLSLSLPLFSLDRQVSIEWWKLGKPWCLLCSEESSGEGHGLLFCGRRKAFRSRRYFFPFLDLPACSTRLCEACVRKRKRVLLRLLKPGRVGAAACFLLLK